MPSSNQPPRHHPSLAECASILSSLSNSQAQTVLGLATIIESRQRSHASATHRQTHILSLLTRRSRRCGYRKPCPKIGGKRITSDWLRSLTEEECRYRFRFCASEIMRLVRMLCLPPIIPTPHTKCKFSAVEALCLVLSYFSNTGNQHHLSMMYSRYQSSISECINEVVEFLDDKWAPLLDFDTEFLTTERLDIYARRIHEAGSPVPSVWAFIDCTIRHICRPSYYQRLAYNGHKKLHALKYQALRTPDGMFSHLYGPVEGRRNDNHLLAASELPEKCMLNATRPGTDQNTAITNKYFQVYGDPAYSTMPYLLSPFSRCQCSRDELAFNAAMSPLRIVVEHGFGDVTRLWPFMNVWWKHKVFWGPVGAMYRVAVLLTNAHNCLHPNATSQYFRCTPPTLEEYFHT